MFQQNPDISIRDTDITIRFDQLWDQQCGKPGILRKWAPWNARSPCQCFPGQWKIPTHMATIVCCIRLIRQLRLNATSYCTFVPSVCLSYTENLWIQKTHMRTCESRIRGLSGALLKTLGDTKNCIIRQNRAWIQGLCNNCGIRLRIRK
jgi:hypothetical protein